MSLKKVSLNLTAKNTRKVETLKKKTGMNQTEIINQAIADVPFIILGDRKSIAASLFDLNRLVENDNYCEFREEVQEICQSLNLLMARIAELQH